MSDSIIEEPDHFRRAQERAEEERLRRSLEREIAGRKELELIYDKCFEDLSESELHEKQAKDGVVRIRRIAQKLKKTVTFLAISLVALAAVVVVLLYTGHLVWVPN